jgi:MoCo/4Fe-4S cofactor protein with predicted Tat translocation signal
MNQPQGKTYWRSLNELRDEPGYAAALQKEFPSAPLKEMGTLSRRRFMQVMGASMALASGSACRWEKENILPFARNPKGRIDGVPQHYATAMELAGHAQPLLATAYDGRPIKLEGNAASAASGGGTSAFAQASILELYDPDRSQNLRQRRGGEVVLSPTWSEFEAFIQPILATELEHDGSGLRVMSEATSSPTVQRLRRALLQKFPQAQWVEFEPVATDHEALGTRLAFGSPLRAHYALKEAQIICALDSDFLTDHPDEVRLARDFAHTREPAVKARADGRRMSRLYAVESRHSTTGAMADHRLAVRSESIQAILLALAAALAKAPAVAALAPQLPAGAAAHIAGLNSTEQAFVAALAGDLLRHRGASALVVGRGQSPQVHALAHQLNEQLGNVGQTVRFSLIPGVSDATAAGRSQAAALAALASQMHQGQVSTLFILGGNPAFTAPAPCRFKEALGQVKNTVHLSLYDDETSSACTWQLPRAHYLEAWSDARTYDGTVALGQPLIRPLYNGKTPAELLSLLVAGGRGGMPKNRGLQLCQQTFAELTGGDAAALTLPASAERPWKAAVQSGLVDGSTLPSLTPTRQSLAAAWGTQGLSQKPATEGLELTLWPDSHVYDGRFANNGWLQELPDFMTKLVWDSAALVAPADAKRLGIAHATLVNLSVGGVRITVPAYVMPGQAAGSVALSLGYGRTQAGQVGGMLPADGDSVRVGYDAYPLLGLGAANYRSGLTLEAEGTEYELATTQDHHALDPLADGERQARATEIIREADLAEYTKDPDFVKERVEHPPLESLWTEFDYSQGHRWGMAIDLNQCIGCNACVTACQAENNIPIVGKEQVINGREMHWIRIDRYFTGPMEAPQVASQPMLCQQCENAPCEGVCPVGASMHSPEGLNDMVYNRCIGTRYCSNNCPYKVRRFNFFNYHKNLTEPRNQVAKMVYNPEVTVRARGVMEKCTYCVQRIQGVKIIARNERRPIRDGEIVTACAAACPAHAISFGDLNDPASEVSKKHADSRSYAVLEQLNTKPRTLYLAKVRNPNPELVS